MIFLADLARAARPEYTHRAAPRRWGEMLHALATEPSTWAIGEFRLRQWGARQASPIRLVTKVVGLISQRLIDITTGIVIPTTARIGPGFHITHYGGVIVNGQTHAGENFTLGHQTTIGLHDGGVPVFGDNVVVAPGARVVGGITVGDGALIGLNAVVLKDVPSRHVASGVPATVRPDTRPMWLIGAE